MFTGVTARSPSRAVNLSRARQRTGLLATATSAEAGKLIVFVPHSGPLGRWRSGLDARISSPRESGRDTTTRSRGGTVTVSVRRSDCGPFTKTTRRVRWPGGTGIRALPPAGEVLRRCLVPFSDTTRWLSATTWRPDGPAPGVSLMVTVFEAGDSAHTTPGRDKACAVARWPSQAATRPATISAPAISKRSSRRSSGGRRPGPATTGRGTRLVPRVPAPLLIEEPAAAAHHQVPGTIGGHEHSRS